MILTVRHRLIVTLQKGTKSGEKLQVYVPTTYVGTYIRDKDGDNDAVLAALHSSDLFAQVHDSRLLAPRPRTRCEARLLRNRILVLSSTIVSG